jgi:large subunit ribosomal protein L1
LVDRDDIRGAVENALDEAPERNFVESVDLAINLRDIDLSDPENRVDREIALPNGRGKDVKIGLFCSEEMATRSGDAADAVVQPEEIEELADDEDEAKTLAREMDFFLAEAPLMPTIGRELGVVLGPRGKMPNPVQPGEDVAETIDDMRRTVRASSGENRTFHLAAGTRDHNPEELTENINRILRRITSALERHEHNLDDVFVKTTMGPAVRIH